MIKQWLNKITWGLLFYLIFLIATLPAHLVVTQDKIGNQAKIGNVTGSIWSGKIDAVQVDKVIIKNVEWQFAFVKLLTGKLALDIEFGSQRKLLEPSGSGILAYGFSGAEAADWKIKFPAEMVTQNIKLPIKSGFNINKSFKATFFHTFRPILIIGL